MAAQLEQAAAQGAAAQGAAAQAEECFDVAALEVWAVDEPHARTLPSCAQHELMSSEYV